MTILRKDDPEWPSCGLFDNLHVDLGKDFRSVQVRAFCAELGIEIRYTRGYHGKSKGNIEGWFGIYEDGMRGQPGYCGDKPENNPERQRLKPEPLDAKNLLTIDQFEDASRRWIVSDYHFRPSRALKGLSPMEALGVHVKNGFSPREVRDESVFDLLLMRRKGAPIKVHNFGIRIFGRKLFAPELLPIVGQYVEPRWERANVGEVLIFQGGKFLCKATNKELLDFGASEATLEREREIKRQQKKSVAERYEQILMRAQYTNDLARAAAEERYEKVYGEEREKIAVNAQTDGVPVLLPQLQRAAKELREAPKISFSQLPEPEEKPQWLKDYERDQDPNRCHKCHGNARLKPSCLYCHERFCDDCIDAHECPEKEKASEWNRRKKELGLDDD